MKRIFISLLLLNFQILHAQSIQWSEGSLVLSNDEVLIGDISLEDTHDLVLFQQGESRMVYSAHQLKALYFYDEPANINRRFVSLKAENGTRTVCQLYEVIIFGEVTVLRKKKSTAFSNHNEALDYNYFARYKNVLSPLVKFSRTIFPTLLASADRTLESFISVNRLNRHDLASSIRIIKFYNSLGKKGEPLARK